MADLALFLSYSSDDLLAVRTIQRALETRGISSFIDRDKLTPGLFWPQALEMALAESQAVAVLIGRELGSWQKREMWFALDRQIREQKMGQAFPVIPVLLPNADLTPSFLFLNTWIDLRHDLTDHEGLVLLESAVRSISSAPTRTVPTEPLALVCPYRGLESFREEDHAFFCGRGAFTERLLRLIHGSGVVGVLGPSGSGKSSVVQAGLLPLLHQERETVWETLTLTPGREPFHRLAAALISLLEPGLSETDRLVELQKLDACLVSAELRLEDVTERILEKSNGSNRLLIIIDQFEELFTISLPKYRQNFILALLRAQSRMPDRLRILLTLRADFYGKAIALCRELSDCLQGATINLGPMTREELKQAFIEPACKLGMKFEAGLEERMLEDLRDEPGNLPLLEFALREFWRPTPPMGGLMTHRKYNEMGGVSGAIAKKAEAEFKGLPSEIERAATRRLFSRLVRVSRAGEEGEDTRRSAELSSLDQTAQEIVRVFARAEARLLVTSRDEVSGRERVEVAHEELIRRWPRLFQWVSEDRDFLLWQQWLQGMIIQWQRSDNSDDLLLRGKSCDEAAKWLQNKPDYINDLERAFISSSAQAEVVRQQAEKDRRTSDERLSRRRAKIRRLTLRVAAIIVVTAGSLALAWLVLSNTDSFQMREIRRKAPLAAALSAQDGYAFAVGWAGALKEAGYAAEANAAFREIMDHIKELNKIDPGSISAEVESGAVAYGLAKAGKTSEALIVAYSISDPKNRDEILSEVVHGLADRGSLVEALAITHRIESEIWQRAGIWWVAFKHIESGRIEEALDIVRTVDRSQISAVTADLVSELARRGKLDYALTSARHIDSLVYRISALDDIAEEMWREGRFIDAKQVSGEVIVAAELFRKEDQFSDRFTDSYVARALARAGDLGGAVKALNRLVEDDYGHTSGLIIVGEILLRAGRFDEAIALAGQLKKPSDQASFLIAMVEVLMRIGDVTRALRVVGEIKTPAGRDEALTSASVKVAEVDRFNESVAIAQRIRDPVAKAKALVQVAGVMKGKGEIEETRRAITAAKRAALYIDGEVQRSSAFSGIADTEANLHYYRQARLDAEFCLATEKLGVYAIILSEYAKERASPGPIVSE